MKRVDQLDENCRSAEMRPGGRDQDRELVGKMRNSDVRSTRSDVAHNRMAIDPD